ncbi:glutathione transferase GstA [Stutzerimonas stutzeri]|uniref:glutathione transferase GstA n=1 Tax=Stutzerimonas stutzeri TaxID=316 RepID=UPI002659BAB3|nr:glutathione transferase GstA [Stutzerimonas stutzeri]MCF6782850.1 glutathione transferase GstA [Stutzerimonas stutzeri]MCF6803961.1 glutathione transferase GstA [Stutzerimonas stutzeri]
MKLYYKPGACSLAPHILLCETEQPYSLVKVDLMTHQTEDGGDYYGINGKGAVPLLELADGTRISEGAVIAQYIAETAGREDLLPATGLPRYRVLEWQNYASAELHKSFVPLFNPLLSQAMDDKARAAFIATLERKYSWVSSQLDGRRYLMGDDFTVADAYLFVTTTWAPRAGVDLSGLVPLQAYAARVAERPAVRVAMQAEGLI